MKNKIYTTYIHLGALLMLLPAIVSSCLYEEPELTADGTKGVDPTQVNIMSEVTLDMNLAPLEINNTRAATTSVNPEKRLGRLYKNQAFQKVQKRNVHEKRWI